MNRVCKQTLVFILIISLMISAFGCKNANVAPTLAPTQNVATPTPEPKTGGELIMAMPMNPRLGDPHIVNTEEMLILYSLIFEGLLSIDDAGKLSPSLAESWAVNPEDSSIWTLKLRKNVKWHDGSDFTAKDVLYTYRRLLTALDMEIPSNSELSARGGAVFAQLAAQPMTEETQEPEPTPTIEPITEPPATIEPTEPPTETPIDTPIPTPTPDSTPTPSKRPQATPTMRPSPTPKPSPTPEPAVADASYYSYHISRIENINVIDDYTIRVKMHNGGLSSLYALTFPIMCKSAEEAGTTMIGTGPYKVVEAKKSKVQLTVNENWWRTMPYISNITFLPRADNATALASYEAKQLNFVTTSIVSAGKYRKEGVTKVLDIMTNNIELMIFNYDNPVFSNPNVRKAIMYALDTSRLVSNVYMNKLQDVDVPIAPDSWLYSSKYKVYEYDLDYAKDLLADAGYTKTDSNGVLRHKDDPKNKLSFTLLVNETTDNAVRKNAAEAIKAQLMECGIEVNIVSHTFLPSAPHSKSEYIKQLKEGNFDMALVGFSLSRDCYLEPLFIESEINYGKVSNEKLLSLCSRITAAIDESSMREAAYAFEAAFIEELPFIVLGYRLNSIIYSANIYGISAVREPDIMRSIDKWYIAD
jgi:peptide/nickel transport system substrate-binding protein